MSTAVFSRTVFAEATWREFTPYGAPRGPAVTWFDNHGFLNKVADANTGLTDIGAREYDPATGRFISLDPILETSSPQQLNGYTYAADNPVTQADPSGLMLFIMTPASRPLWDYAPALHVINGSEP